MLCFGWWLAASLISSVIGQEPDPDTEFVIVGLRHAFRTPEQFCCGFRSSDPPLSLTNLGIRQAWFTGRFLRRRYADFISQQYNSNSFKGFSSSAERCQSTLQAISSGLFQLQSDLNPIPNSSWVPVPYQIDDKLLRMYKVPCKASSDAWAPITSDELPELRQVLNTEKEFIAFTLKNANLSGGDSQLSLMADVADNLMNIKANVGEVVPSWMNGVVEKNGTEGIQEKILGFAEIHQIACARFPPCRKMMAGLWLHQIEEMIIRKQKGDFPDAKMAIYVTHTEIVLSALYGMGVSPEDVRKVEMGGGFILEYKSRPEPLIRLIYLHPNPSTPELVGHVTNIEEEGPTPTVVTPNIRSDWRNVDKFLEEFRGVAFGDFEKQCHNNSAGFTNSTLVLMICFLMCLF